MRRHAIRDNGVVLFARCHRLGMHAAFCIALGAVQLLVGQHRVDLPNSAIVFPYRSLLGMGFPLAIAGLWNSAMSGLEEVNVSRPARVGLLASLALTAATCCFELLAFSLTHVVEVGIVEARSVLIWLALSIVGRNVVKSRGFWIFPVATVVPLTYFDPAAHQRPAWWNWPLQTDTARGVWALAALFWVLAGLTSLVTGWRRYLVVQRLTRGRPGNGPVGRHPRGPALDSTCS